ncbi:hypothetical protein [Magnetofaba australis]|nr:hypothetical protein [Magnetofaba australis]
MGHEQEKTTALVVLRDEESRALIGGAVAQLPQVQQAKASGRLVIVGGGSARYAAWSLTGEDPGRDAFAVGCVQDGALGETPKAGRGPGPIIFENGEMSRGWPGEVLQRFEAGDIYVKGGNAIDAAGNVAVLMASPVGGTIGAAWAIICARGAELVMPVSLNKLVPSVMAATPLMGQGRVDRVMGTPVGYMPIPAGSATVITEVEAFRILFDVEATPVAAGGFDDCAGSLTLHLSGSLHGIEMAWQAIEGMR